MRPVPHAIQGILLYNPKTKLVFIQKLDSTSDAIIPDIPSWLRKTTMCQLNCTLIYSSSIDAIKINNHAALLVHPRDKIKHMNRLASFDWFMGW